MAAVTQIRHRHSPGRAYYERKIAEGHTGKEATRALKRRISDAIYTRLRDDAARATGLTSTGPGGHPGNDTETCAAGSHPEHRLFDQAHQATPRPATTIRPTDTRIRPPTPKASPPAIRKPLDVMKERGLRSP
jgi:transposase